MKASQLDYEHCGKTLVTGTGSKRKRGKILDLDLSPRTYLTVTVQYTHGKLRVVLPFDTEIEIEE